MCRSGLTLLVAIAGILTAQPPASSSTVAVHAIVTAEGKKGEAPSKLNPEDAQIRQGDQRLRATDVRTVRSAGLDLWVIIDDGLETAFGTQLQDIKSFILAQPPTVRAGIGYMRNGTVIPAADLSNDHNAVAKAVRLPMGTPGASASPYLSLVDLIGKWPEGSIAREVLLITSGIDPDYGTGPDNPYLMRAIEAAQKSGVLVHSIYYGGAGHFGHSYWQITWGQNYLAQLADATGGEFFWQGYSNPVSVAPYLKELTEHLDNQYLLTFAMNSPKKGGLQAVRFGTELPHTTISGPAKVYVGSVQ